MYEVIRRYTGNGAADLMDLLEKNKDEIKSLLQGVNGFVSYSLFRTADGGVSATICQDKAGVDESVKIARDWVQQNASGAAVVAPEVIEGEVITQF
jgi:hypothetical protein